MDRKKPPSVSKVKPGEAEPGLIEYLGSMPRLLDRWMFGHASPVTMGVMRLTLGFLALANLLLILPGFEDWFTERGYVPQEVARTYAGEIWRLNLLGNVYDGRITLAFYLLITLSAFLTMIGLWSRVSSAVLAIGMITLHHRNMVVLHGGDVILRMALIYIAFAPSGAACSVDRLLKLWKGKAPPIPVDVSMWPQRLMQIQIAVVYYTTVWSKWMGFHWKDGTAAYYPMHLNEFHRFWLPDFMRENPTIVMISTYGTLATELAMATIVFYKPLRKYALLAGVGMHLFIEYSMNIPLFAFIMIATYLSFFEGQEMSGWAKSVGERFKKLRVRVFAPSDRKLKPGPALALQAMDPFNFVDYLPDGEANDWKAEGKTTSGAKSAMIRSIGAWPLVVLPGLWRRLLNKSLE
ncbi:MAG: HTTM domain-containing protein [Fimbriimonadaceae bacterium]|nr:HTTM domain-containing protein [Fimbriimonadaceae bacterium]